MEVTIEQHKFMVQLIEKLENSGADELVFDMDIKGKAGKRYIFKYVMSKAAPANN